MPCAVARTAASRALATRAAAGRSSWYEHEDAQRHRHSLCRLRGRGTLEDVLAARGVALRYLEAGVDDLADAKGADLLIVLGGLIGIYEVARYPFLRDEFAAIEAALRHGTPLIGICFGAQAIAATLGSRVYPGRGKEIDWGLISLSRPRVSARGSQRDRLQGAALARRHLRPAAWHDAFGRDRDHAEPGLRLWSQGAGAPVPWGAARA
ncbi:MAG: hypothetical protein WB662_05560 [Methyloceanibacter sp.]